MMEFSWFVPELTNLFSGFHQFDKPVVNDAALVIVGLYTLP